MSFSCPATQLKHRPIFGRQGYINTCSLKPELRANFVKAAVHATQIPGAQLLLPSSHAPPATIMPPAQLLGAQLLSCAAPSGRTEPSHMPLTTHAWANPHLGILAYCTKPHTPSHTALLGNWHRTSDPAQILLTPLSYSQVIH